MPYFYSNGIHLYYESVGSGPALVFIPPPALGAASFLQQQEGLKDHFQVITFDPIGNGNSSAGNKKTHSVKEWAEDVRALADHLELDNIIPCGYSMGGAAAQEFAVSYPHRTAGLVLICTFPEVSTWMLHAKIKIGEWTFEKDLRSLLAEGLAISHTNRKDNKHWLKKWVKRSYPTLVKNMYYQGRQYQVTDKLSTITCPVTYIYGRFDPVARPYIDLYKKHLPNFQFVKIPGTTHQIPTRAANEVNGIISGIYSRRWEGDENE
ncbi:alpha/beta fold hydrolase [Salsuginibacillus kocurii]|uniref:alpha/beta fold hydrolase n=1 Tax=Salsuginibacillus kocurii TaxID=427078 RepID=UPI00036AA3D5|nr:alpha/beta hydrolase [Salsuginibacillus kocurii]